MRTAESVLAWRAPEGCARGVLLRLLRTSFLVTSMVLPIAGAAHAAKWKACPSGPLPVYRSALGATAAPFIHPSHELRILLNSAQVASGGGFSVEPKGNLVEITFASLFGEPISLASRRVAAASPGTLTFPFPDTTAEVGRPLAGPVEIRVTKGEKVVARIDPQDLVALPPAIDVTSMLLGETPRQVVYGALSADGDLWVPALFNGDPMPMPGCPGDFMMPMPIGAATIPGLVVQGAEPLARIRRMSLYLGDMDIGGTSFYGMLFSNRISLVHAGGTRGVTLCQMNDSIDLVLRVKGSRAWSRSKRSPMREVVLDAAPIPLLLKGAKSMPETAKALWIGEDSFGNSCEPTPPTLDVTPGKP